MNISNLGKNITLGLGVSAGVLSTPSIKSSTLNKKYSQGCIYDNSWNCNNTLANDDLVLECVTIPHQHLNELVNGNLGIIATNLEKFKTLSNQEQQNLYDTKYNETLTSTWKTFLNQKTLSDMGSGEWQELNASANRCLDIKFIDAKNKFGENYKWYEAANKITNSASGINLILPLSKPILPDLDTLNVALSENELNNTIAYLSLSDYNECLQTKVRDFCRDRELQQFKKAKVIVGGALMYLFVVFCSSFCYVLGRHRGFMKASNNAQNNVPLNNICHNN